MNKRSDVKIVLDELGLKTRAEVSLARKFAKGVLDEKGGRLERVELKKLFKLYQQLVGLDVRPLCNIPSSTVVGLGHVLFLALKEEGLKFVSFASPAYKQDLLGRHIDIGDGRDKKEYRALAVIDEKLRGLALPYSYNILFVDIDPEVAGKSLEEVENLFTENFKGLCAVSSVSAKRLSRVVNTSHLKKLEENARASEKVTNQIRKLQDRPTVLKAHKIGREEIAERAVIYTALGKLLEEVAPKTILLDIQGRIYPYEQPFYDTLRRFPLPLLRLVKM